MHALLISQMLTVLSSYAKHDLRPDESNIRSALAVILSCMRAEITDVGAIVEGWISAVYED